MHLNSLFGQDEIINPFNDGDNGGFIMLPKPGSNLVLVLFGQGVIKDAGRERAVRDANRPGLPSFA